MDGTKRAAGHAIGRPAKRRVNFVRRARSQPVSMGRASIAGSASITCVLSIPGTTISKE